MAKQDNELTGCLGLFFLPVLIILGLVVLVLGIWVILPHNSNIIYPLIYSALIFFSIILIPLLLKIIEKFDIRSLYIKGDKLCKNGQYETAIECYSRAYNKYPSTAEYYYYATGMVYYEQKKYNKALTSLIEALAVTKNNTEKILLTTIDIYAEQENYSATLEFYDILISTFKEGSKKYNEYQKIKSNYSKNTDKIKQERIQKRSQDLYKTGLNYAKNYEFWKATEFLKDALSLVPENEEYKLKLSEFQNLYEQEKYKAEDVYKKALSLYNEKQYLSAITVLEKAETILQKQNISEAKINSLKNEILGELNKIKEAQDIYNLALKSYKFKDYNCTLINVQKAIQLVPDNEKYKEFLLKLQKELDELSVEVKALFNDSLECKKSRDFKSALYYINEALKMARERKLYTAELIKYKDELTKYVNNIQKAENKFYNALQFYADKNYESAIHNLENAIFLIPDNEDYRTKLQEIKDIYKRELSKADNFYNNAKIYLKSNNFENAINEINNALKLFKDRKYIKLKNDIESKQRKFQGKQRAEKLYSEAKILYSSNNTNYDKILDLLNEAIALSPKKAYDDMFSKVKKENDYITAEKLYEDAKKYFNNKDYNKGLSSIKQAVKLNPSNRIYIDLKQKIDWEQKEDQKREKAVEHFKYGLEAMQDADFNKAIENFEKVLNLQPYNSDCETLLNKARIGKVDITNCTKKALLTLDFINEEQAENIIQARNNGIMWYEYQKFAEQFGIMPHQWADVEEKIEFPLKQANKYGRRLDW